MYDTIDNEEIKGLEKTAKESSYYTDRLPRGYLSVSQVAQYIKCGEAYRRRYLLDQAVPSTTFQVQGRGVHKAAEHLHLSIMGQQPLSLEETKQIYSDTHDQEIKDAIVDKDEEVDVKSLKDVGISLTSKYHAVAMGTGKDDKTGLPVPAVQPVAAERVIRTMLYPEDGDPVPFMGVIDLEEPLAIADLKTKKLAGSTVESDNSIQLSLYAYVTGKATVRLDQLVKPTKTQGPRYIRLAAIRSKREVMHALDVVAEVASDISAGRFRKTNPENWWCSEKWCPYWGECRGRKR
jgi:hypothetical protein